MNAATRSVRPYFLHKRMVPKWLALLAMAALAFTLDAPHRGLLIGLGVLAFFPSEYIVHRGVFHHFADKRAGKVVSVQHVSHHEEPDDLDYLFNHPPLSIGVGVLYFLVYWAASGVVGDAAAFSLGNFIGLAYYEWVHLAAHRPGARPWTPWGRFLKKWHLWHHYKNERYWFGVTSPVFDLLFGTHGKRDEVPRSDTVRTLIPPREHEIWLDNER